ncbi:MAG: CBM9 family sugar-binding protein [Gammaproteobacteria bacterium]|nr:CBM9 family sugar-binding protein [Gammaproteobacteria bacterium]
MKALQPERPSLTLTSLLFLLGLFQSCQSIATELEKIDYTAQHLKVLPTIDGSDTDHVWKDLPWYPIDQLILGNKVSQEDFYGRFKIAWNKNQIYLLAEIQDDVLIDTHADPLEFYWDDDALEIFIDSDNSGGIHKTNHSAFAYHVSLDNQLIDIGTNGKPINFSNHGHSVWKRSSHSPHSIIWEVALDVYDHTYDEAKSDNQLEILSAGKRLGFALAYCDADYGRTREHFISSKDVPAVDGNKNRGYIDADTFGTLLLQD